MDIKMCVHNLFFSSSACLVSSEGAATTNSLTAENSSASISREMSRENSEIESETRFVQVYTTCIIVYTMYVHVRCTV